MVAKKDPTGPIFVGAVITQEEEEEEVTGLHDIALQHLAVQKTIIKDVDEQITRDGVALDALLHPDRIARAKERHRKKREIGRNGNGRNGH